MCGFHRFSSLSFKAVLGMRAPGRCPRTLFVDTAALPQRMLSSPSIDFNSPVLQQQALKTSRRHQPAPPSFLIAGPTPLAICPQSSQLERNPLTSLPAEMSRLTLLQSLSV